MNELNLDVDNEDINELIQSNPESVVVVVVVGGP